MSEKKNDSVCSSNIQGLTLFPSHLLERGGIPFNKYCQEVFNTQVAPEIDYNELIRIYREQYKAQYGFEIKTKDAPELFPIEVFEGFEYHNRVRLEKALIGFVLRAFNDYINTFKTRRYIYCRNAEGKELFLPLSHRFSINYTRKIRSRISSLVYKYGNAKTVLLTLTVDPSLFDNKLEMWTTIKKEFNRFMTALRYRFKRDNKRRLRRGLPAREFPSYLSTIQAQENGNPHIHVIFLNATRLLDWTEIRDVWKLGYIFINRSPEGKKIRSPINYVSRYITRTFTKTDKSNVLTQALVWFFGVRSYSCSRGLLLPLHMPSGEFNAICMIILSSSEVPFAMIHDPVRKYVDAYLNWCVPP